MAKLLFDSVVSQYIDNNGKTRMLTYGGDDSNTVCLMVSPIPPLGVAIDKTIIPASMATVLKFIKERGLLIVSQDGNADQGIQGVWVETKEQNVGIYYGYIPITPPTFLASGQKPRLESKKVIANVPFSDRGDPIRTDPQSELSNFRRNRKIAEILKQYVLYTYANEVASIAGEIDFNENYFWVDPDHTYDIDRLNKKLFREGNDVIYREGYIVVPSEDIRDRLLAYLKVNLLNDTPGILSMADPLVSGAITPTTINTGLPLDNYYQVISDFRLSPGSTDQIIFTSTNGLKRWKRDTIKKQKLDPNMISSAPMENQKDPYYYRNPKIGKATLMLIQNVAGGLLENALAVAWVWSESKVKNIGYTPSVDAITTASKVSLTYIIYTESGEIERVTSKTKPQHIFRYESGAYAALLFI